MDISKILMMVAVLPLIGSVAGGATIDTTIITSLLPIMLIMDMLKGK